MKTAIVARQPIFNADNSVYAYELLYRLNPFDEASVITHGQENIASSDVVINTFKTFGLDHVAPHHPVFINFTPEFLQYDVYSCLPSDRVIVDIVANGSELANNFDIMRQLKDNRFRFAVEVDNYADVNDALLALANFIRIDINGMSAEEVSIMMQRIDTGHVKKIAVKIETHECLSIAKQAGFDLFQGFYLCHPQSFAAMDEELSVNQTTLLNLIAKLQEPDITIAEIEALISIDVKIATGILKIINSAAYALPRKVDSIAHAVTYLGLDFVRNWLIMLSMSNLDNTPQELCHIAMLRARMCSLLADKLNADNPSAYFTVGLLSVLEGLLNRPMALILTELPLEDSLSTALLSRSGRMGEVLAGVEAYEQGQWDHLRRDQLHQEDFAEAYIDSMDWMHEVLSAVA